LEVPACCLRSRVLCAHVFRSVASRSICQRPLNLHLLLLPLLTRIAPARVFSITHRAFRFCGWVGRPPLTLLCVVRFCAITACLGGSALGTYVSILLAIEALLELAAPIVEFALLHRRLDNETLINCYVRVFGFGKFDNEGGSFLVLNRFGGEPSNELYFHAFDNAVVLHLDLFDDLRLVGDVDPVDPGLHGPGLHMSLLAPPLLCLV
jgi:hypothetical protein